MKKEDYILIYDQKENFQFIPIELVKKGELDRFIKDRYSADIHAYLISDNMVIVNKKSVLSSNFNDKTDYIAYMHGDLDKIPHFKNYSLEQIEDIIMEDDLKNIKKSRRYISQKKMGTQKLIDKTF